MTNQSHEATKRCPSCDEVISAKAKKCPKCQHDLRNWISRHPILTVLGIIFLMPFIIGNLILSSVPSNESQSESPTPPRKTELNAKVNFTDGQFTITNFEDTDCIGAWLKVNGKYSLDGYTLEAGQIYTVGAMQFAEGDGTRLNPFNTKVQNFSISCQGDNELTRAFWYGEWN